MSLQFLCLGKQSLSTQLHCYGWKEATFFILGNSPLLPWILKLNLNMGWFRKFSYLLTMYWQWKDSLEKLNTRESSLHNTGCKQTCMVLFLTQNEGFSHCAFLKKSHGSEPGVSGCFSQYPQLESTSLFSTGPQGQEEKEWHMCLHSQRLKCLTDLTCIWIAHYHRICCTDIGFSGSWERKIVNLSGELNTCLISETVLVISLPNNLSIKV